MSAATTTPTAQARAEARQREFDKLMAECDEAISLGMRLAATAELMLRQRMRADRAARAKKKDTTT